MTTQPPTPPYAGPPAHSSGNNNKPINRVVIHCTVSACGIGARDIAAYFRTSAAGGSAHYVTDATQTIQAAYDSVVCWHAPPNPHSLGVEMCCTLADQGKGHWTRPDHVAMMKRTAALVAQLCLAYDVPLARLSVSDLKAGKRGICGHVDVSQAFNESTHWDPGPYFPWDTFMAMVHVAAENLQTDPKPEPAKRTLKVGTFNLLRGRKPNDVLREVIQLLDTGLDVLAVQEAEDYFEPLSRIKDFDYFADPDNPENGVLVVEDRGSDFYSHEVGDGWTREGGATRGPGMFPRVTVDGWCRIGSQHWPPSTNWKDGKLVAPPERVGDVREWAEASLRFLDQRDQGATGRVLLSDYNEAASTKGELSPGWVAQETHARIGSTGGIDWGMGTGVTFRNGRHVSMREKSDHDPKTFEVVEA